MSWPGAGVVHHRHELGKASALRSSPEVKLCPGPPGAATEALPIAPPLPRIAPSASCACAALAVGHDQSTQAAHDSRIPVPAEPTLRALAAVFPAAAARVGSCSPALGTNDHS